MYVDISDLPDPILKLLGKVRYMKKDIQVETRERVSPFGGGQDGYREFVGIVNLGTEECKVEYGSWGGSNPFNANNRVDRDTQSYDIPPNFAVVKGSEGGSKPVSCTLYIRSDMVAGWLPSGKELNSREQWIIDTLKSYNPRGRKDEFNRYNRVAPSQAEFEALKAKGLVKMNKAGAVSLTTEGKNAANTGYGRTKYATPAGDVVEEF